MRFHEVTRRLAGAAGISILLRISWAVLNYLGIMLFARWFDVVDYGIFALILSNVTIFGVICALGTQTSVLRFLGEYKSAKEYALIKGVSYFYTYIVFLCSCLFTILCIFVIISMGYYGKISNAMAFAIGMALIPSFALCDTQSGIARSFGSVFVALAPRDVLWRGGIIALAFVSTHLIDTKVDELELFLSCACVLLSLLTLWQNRSAFSLVNKFCSIDVRQFEIARWVSIAWPIWIANIAVVSQRTLDVIIVGAVLNPEDVGYYFAASRTAALVGFILMSINIISGPQIAQSFHSKDERNLRRVLAFSSIISFIPALTIFIMFAVFGSQILGFFGPEFRQYSSILIVLATGQLASSFFGSSGLLMDLSGHERANTRILISTTVITTGSMFIAGFVFGPIGVALCSSAGLAVWNARRWFYIKRNLGYDSSALSVVQFFNRLEER